MAVRGGAALGKRWIFDRENRGVIHTETTTHIALPTLPSLPPPGTPARKGRKQKAKRTQSQVPRIGKKTTGANCPFCKLVFTDPEQIYGGKGLNGGEGKVARDVEHKSHSNDTGRGDGVSGRTKRTNTPLMLFVLKPSTLQ